VDNVKSVIILFVLLAKHQLPNVFLTVIADVKPVWLTRHVILVKMGIS